MVVAGLTVEQSEGRRAQRAVYTPEGYIVVAQGQIVTTKVIDRAKANHQESALLNAVGLSTSGAAQSTANTLATNTGHQLKTTGAIASEQVQAGVSQLWDKVKETASDLQGKSTQVIEEKRIKGALGRPTTRVILDPNDEVILNVGELITHKAIDSARSVGILDLLLDSVYTETPQLSVEELRAPTAGKSAL
jgi:pyrimidine deaminase RibD-like protein